MSNIDKRIVEMQFDNKQFEKGVKESEASIENLKKTLEFKDVNNNHLSKIANGIGVLNERFSTLGIIGMSVISNLTNKLVDFGLQAANAIVVRPMVDGFNEYELSMNSVRTIMNGTGESLETVNRYLDELNRYADMTIYSFSDMTSSIGKFTNAGVGLPVAVEAIRGIANATADAGQGSQQASMAMYNFSQAIASGTLKLQDWKSIELANIATKSFKEELIKTGLEMGTLAKQGDTVVTMTEDTKGKVNSAEVTWQKFRDTLKENWITSDVLLTTLGRYSDVTTDIGKRATSAATKVTTFTQLLSTAQESLGSGWKSTWDIVFGDFNEATELWTGANNVFSEIVAASEEARNSLLKGGLSTGWKQLMDEGISDTEGFKETILETFQEIHGISFADVYGDEALDSATDFRLTLYDGWVTSEMLGISIAKTADSVRGLSKEELVAKGYTEEQAKAMLDLDEKVKNGTISLEEYVDKISSMSGRENIIRSLSNAFDGLKSILHPIGEAFREIFPTITGEQLYVFTERLKDLTSKFKIGEELANNLKSTFGGLFALLNIGKTIITNLLSVFGKVIGAFLPAGGSVLEFSGNIGEMLMKLDKAIQTSGVFKAMFEGIGTMLTTVAKVIGKAFSVIADAWKQMTGSINFSWLTVFSKIFETIGKVFSKVGDVIRSAFRNMDAKNFMDIFNAGVLATILLGIRKFINNFKTMFEDGFGFLDGVKALLDGVKGSLEAWQQSLKAKTLLKIASAIAILAGALFLLATIDPTRLASALGAITVLFLELFGAMKAFSMIMKGDGFKSMSKITKAMIGMSTAVLILSFAMKNLGNLDWGQITKGLTAIGVLMLELLGVSYLLDKSGAKLVKGSVGLILFSTAMVILAQAVKSFGSMQWDEIGKGIVGLSGALTAITIAMNLIPKGMVGQGVALIAISTAMLILSNALKSFGSMQWDEIGRGLTGLAGALTAITAAMNLMPKGMVGQAIALIGISTAMIILSNALKSFGSMQWDEIGRGLTSLAGALAAITIALRLLPKGIMSQAVSLILIATSLVILSNALKSMGGMSWDEIARGLVTLAGSLLVIAGAMYLMTGALPGAAALLVVAGALLMLVPVLTAFSNMSWESIAKSMVMLAGIFTIFGVSALLLTPVIPVMFALAGALLLLGVAVSVTGVGLLALSVGLTALATAFTASGAAIFAVLEGLIGLIPTILGKIGEGIVALATAIGNGTAAIIEAVTKILAGIFQAIIDSAPKFFESVTVLLVGICQLIIDTAPKFIEAIFVVLTALLDELIEFIPKFVDASMKIMTGILTGIAENIPDIAKAGTDVVIAFLRAIGTETPRIIDAGFKMIIDFINGLADSIRENTPELIVAGQNLADALLRAIADVLTGGIFGFSKKGKESGEAYEGGMASKIKDIRDKAGEAANKALEGLKSKTKEMYNAGVDGVTGFINGLGSKIKGVIDKAKALGTAAITAAKTALDSHSPSKEFIYIGRAIGEGLAIGIDNSIGDPVRAISNMMGEIMNIASGDFEKFEKWMSDRKYFEEISLIEELTAWELIQNAACRSAEEREKAEREVFRIQKELVKETYQYSVDWMDERKYYGELTLAEELAAWERVQSRYMEGSDERKKADREVYRLRNELKEASYQHSLNWITMEKEAGRLSLEAEITAYERIKSRYSETDEEYTAAVKAQTQARIDAKKAEFDHSMDWIEQRKYYGELTLAEELAAYTRVQQRYEKGTEERIKMDKKVYRLQKEINEARTKYYDDVAKIEEDRKNKRIQLEQEYADKTKEINQKLQDDIKQLDDNYKNALDSRTKAIYNSYGLFDKVEAKKAVSGSTLMKNLQDQVDDLDKWQNQLSQLSAKGLNSALIDELQEMGPSAMAELEALNSMSSSELAQYATLWSTKHKQAKTQATSELEDLRIETQSQIADLRVESAKELDDYRKMWNQQMSDLNTETNKQLKQLKKDFDKQIGIVKANTEADFREMTSNVKEVMQQAGWNEMGQQIVDGLSGGVDSRKQSFIDTIIGVIQGGIAAAQNVADMHSPSRVFAKMGRYMDEGLVVGLKQYSNRVVDASADVGREAIDSMSNAISGIGSVVNGDMDIAPTIRPVMDMSDFRSGLNYMDTALTADRSMLLGATAANQNRTNSYIDELASKLSDANTQSNNKITSAIEGIKSDFAGLVDKVTKLQVVMDTGTLVGAIGPDMDRELGGLSNMTRRGVR